VKKRLPEDFYNRIEPRLYRRIGRELQLAYRVLDIGCGDCELCDFLVQTYAQQVIGVDISAEKLPLHRQRNRGSVKSNPQCIKADARSLNFLSSGSIDAVVMMWSLHEMRAPVTVLREAHRILRPGGEILVVDFPRRSLAVRLWDEKYHTCRETTGMMRRAGFEKVICKLLEHRQVMLTTGFRAPRRGKA
jgi:ubiquinone/menaquinone biosynthesis C-methylase UbiE